MLDPVVPPAVVEGEIDGGADGVRPIAAASLAVIVNNRAAFSPPLWITTTAADRVAVEELAVDAAADPASRPLMLRLNRSRYRIVKTLPRASSPSSMTCSSRPRSRKLRASSM